MDRSSEFRETIERLCSQGASLTQRTRRAPSPFLMKANEVFAQLHKFEAVLKSSYEGFVGFHRLLPQKCVPPGLAPLSKEERARLSDEMSVFASNTAKSIQDLNRMLELSEAGPQTTDSSAHQFNRQVVSSLLQKLNRLSVQWERMQRDRKRIDTSPCRILSSTYAHHLLASTELETASHETPSSVSIPVPVPAPVPAPAQVPRTEASFSQRYVDEIAPSKKMREYEAVANAQKDQLLREAHSLRKKHSQELAESYHVEHTVHSISGLVAEFTAMIDDQSGSVQAVGQVAKDVVESVKHTDEELLKTLERSQQHQLNMMSLMLGLAALLLLLHWLSP